MTTFAEWCEDQSRMSAEEYEALVDYLDNEHKTIHDKYDSDTITYFEESYQGYWPTFEDFVETQVRELHDIPDWLDQHIDWDSVAGDWQHDYWQSDNGHIFQNI